jgi:CheY-like chemotaxis protein
MTKILIVDDVDYIRKSLTKVLEESGFDCDSVENGAIACEKLKTKEYDLIITDIMMPDMDGFEFLDYIRDQAPPLGKIPILAISGGSKTINSDMALQLVNEKANMILQKPFAKADIVNAVTKVLGNAKFSSSVSG